MPRPPEFRTCPATGRMVLIAPERAARPNDNSLSLATTAGHPEPRDCPFCPGNEHFSESEVFSTFRPNSKDWQLRVVPNRYPAVRIDCESAYGLHEVLISTPRPICSPVELTSEEAIGMWRAVQSRFHSHAGNPRLLSTSFFQNMGAAAGASLAHLHAQLISLPMLPTHLRDELESAKERFRITGKCIYCERPPAERIVLETEHFLALCPYAPRFEFEVWILRKAHASQFENASEVELKDFSAVVSAVQSALNRVLEIFAFNSYLHSGPLRSEAIPSYHWHLEIAPRSAVLAGFELGSGIHVVAVPPEEAASALRVAITRAAPSDTNR